MISPFRHGRVVSNPPEFLELEYQVGSFWMKMGLSERELPLATTLVAKVQHYMNEKTCKLRGKNTLGEN
jgi:hypothetical protein